MAKKKKGNEVGSLLGKVITTDPSTGIVGNVVKLIGMTVDVYGFGEITQNIINPWLESLRLSRMDINKNSNVNDLLAEQQRLAKKIYSDQISYTRMVNSEKAWWTGPKSKEDAKWIDNFVRSHFKDFADGIEQDKIRYASVVSLI
jgi:hypothetical protein